MSIRKKIEDNLQLALKEKNRTLISTLRLIMAGIKDKDIACRSKDNKEGIKDEDIKQLLKKMIKQRNESIAIYKKGNRNDLLDIENKEVQIISKSFLSKYPAHLVVVLEKTLGNSFICLCIFFFIPSVVRLHSQLP